LDLADAVRGLAWKARSRCVTLPPLQQPVPVLIRASRARGRPAVGPNDQQRNGRDSGAAVTVIGRGRPIHEMSRELVWALAEDPRLVVCDLTDVAISASAGTELFSPILPYLADWPGVGVVVVAPDVAARASLETQPLPPTVIVSDTRDAGVDRLNHLLPLLSRVDLHLMARLTAPTTARRFTARSLVEWQLLRLIAPMSLVVSELVTNSVVHAASTVDLALSRADGRLQMTVRDRGVGHPVARFEEPEDHYLGGRGLLLVEETSRAWGVLPARGEGKTVWAVFDSA
jgi:anti-sigma regulatory factor (Ser/Thr protein kinase)